jgi:tripeptidyl-peptidase I
MIWITLFTGTLILSRVSVATPFERWHDFAEKHAWAEIPKGWELMTQLQQTMCSICALASSKIN